MKTCTRCEGAGFLNLEQAPDEIANGNCEIILGWIVGKGAGSDVQVCDCCGNGQEWYGEPGQHYSSYDPAGPTGPYAYNGGLCECH